MRWSVPASRLVSSWFQNWGTECSRDLSFNELKSIIEYCYSNLLGYVFFVLNSLLGNVASKHGPIGFSLWTFLFLHEEFNRKQQAHSQLPINRRDRDGKTAQCSILITAVICVPSWAAVGIILANDPTRVQPQLQHILLAWQVILFMKKYQNCGLPPENLWSLCL